MNSGLSIKNLTAFAVAFMLVFGYGLLGSSLTPDASGIAWADDDDEKKKKVPTIIVYGRRGQGVHRGWKVPVKYTPQYQLMEKVKGAPKAACTAAVDRAKAAGAVETAVGTFIWYLGTGLGCAATGKAAIPCFAAVQAAAAACRKAGGA